MSTKAQELRYPAPLFDRSVQGLKCGMSRMPESQEAINCH